MLTSYSIFRIIESIILTHKNGDKTRCLNSDKERYLDEFEDDGDHDD